MKTKRFIAAVLLIFACVTIVSAQKANLSFNPTEGSQYQFNMEFAANADQTFAGMSQPIGSRFVLEFTLDSIKKRHDVVEARLICRRLLISIANGRLQIKYDSEQTTDLPYDRTAFDTLVNKILNSPFYLTISPDGKVLSTTGIENFDLSDLDSSEVSVEDGELKLSFEITEEWADGTRTKKYIEDALQFYPPNAVKSVGDTWLGTGETTINDQPTQIKYTLTGIDNGVANINIGLKKKLKAPKGNVAISQSGFVHVDVKTGLPTNYELATNYSVKAKVDFDDEFGDDIYADGNEYDEMEMSMTSKVIISIREIK